MAPVPEDQSPPNKAPSPLPPAPADGSEPLNAEQWRLFAALSDTIVPSFTAAATANPTRHYTLSQESYDRARATFGPLMADRAVLDSYLGESATAQPEYKAMIMRFVGWYMTEDARWMLTFVLNSLNSRAGALLLTGYSTPLHQLPVKTREQVLKQWKTSRLPFMRSTESVLGSLVKIMWLRTSPTLGPVLGFPHTPTHGPPVSASFPFQFLQIPPSSKRHVITADVIIVGSGCGGAVAAKTLAEAGLKVLVVDRKHYWNPSHLPMSEAEGGHHLFLNGGLIKSEIRSLTVIAGAGWGGGGTINWSASIQTQGYVRREWSEKFGLPHFTSSEFQADLDAVCERMGVGISAIEHNKGNRVLLDGSKKLGWSAKPVPQNTAGKAHNCGFCSWGCGSCGKQGPTETFLPDAAGAGATFIEGFNVDRILFGDGKTAATTTATGIEGTWTSRDSNGRVDMGNGRKQKVIVKAKHVVISAGTLLSPLILQRSGVQNPHIGQHLHLHPVSLTAAVWDEDQNPWEGSILTSVVDEFEDLDGAGYGPKIEACLMTPSFFMANFPWANGWDSKRFVANFKRMSGYIALVRDRYGGKVFADPVDGRARVDYTVHKHDAVHMLEGVVRLSQILYVEGAREIHTSIPGLEPFVRSASTHQSSTGPSLNDSEFQAWIQKLRKTGFPSPQSQAGSAHQMGTCRMGSHPYNSVVNQDGRVWGTSGLSVADTSVFPSASGANPMITAMGIARGIARSIVTELARSGGGGVTAKL